MLDCKLTYIVRSYRMVLSFKFPVLISLLCLAVSLGAGCASHAHHQSASGPIAEAVIRSVEGNVEYKNPGDDHWSPAIRGTTLTEGSVIKTGPASTADLYIAQVSTVRLVADSELKFEKLQVTREGAVPEVHAEVNLPRGRVQGSTLKWAPHSKFLVTTPNGSYEVK